MNNADGHEDRRHVRWYGREQRIIEFMTTRLALGVIVWMTRIEVLKVEVL